jgi:hypothetical protein
MEAWTHKFNESESMQPASLCCLWWSGASYRYNWGFVLITCWRTTRGRVFITFELKCELRQAIQNTPSHTIPTPRSPISCSTLEYQKHGPHIPHKPALKRQYSNLHSTLPFIASPHTITWYSRLPPSMEININILWQHEYGPWLARSIARCLSG